MSGRPSAPALGEFELLVLLATISLGETAYPVSIAADIERRTGRKASRAAVLITLERLEDKGMLTSWFGDPTPVRGGRAKRHFTLRPLGIRAVRQAVAQVQAMTVGLESILRAR
jgi:PadR family transcriptional regulator PadR